MAHARKFIREPGVFGYDGHNIPYENHGQYKNQKKKKGLSAKLLLDGRPG